MKVKLSFLYFLLKLITFFIFCYIFLHIGAILLMVFFNLLLNLLNFIPILKYLIPVYFLLSLYSINYKGYYHLKFFGYDISSWHDYFDHYFLKFKSLVYNYKFLFLLFFVLILLLSFFYEKVYFVIIFFFSLLYIVLFYIYNNYNKLKEFITYFFFSFNIVFVFIIIIVLKNENLDIPNNILFSDFTYKITSPRLLFKNSFHKLFPEYSEEIKRLLDGLCVRETYLKENYLRKFRNLDLRVDYSLSRRELDRRYLNHESFLNGSHLYAIEYFKDIFLINTLKPLNKKLLLNHANFNDENLFNMPLDPIINNYYMEYPLTKVISFKEHTSYINSYFRQLGLSKNLLVNANLKSADYASIFNRFYAKKNHLFSRAFDNQIEDYINNSYYDTSYYKDYYNNQFLSILNAKYSDYFVKLKLEALKFSNVCLLVNEKNNKDSKDSYDNLVLYYKYLNSNFGLNKYNIYENSMFFKIEKALSDLQLNSNKDFDTNVFNYKTFDVESLIYFLNKYYRGFNINSNLINWLYDFFIILFDSKKKVYSYWDSDMHLEFIKDKDRFNLYRNLLNSFLYDYKKNLDIFAYNEYKRSKVHYESVTLPSGAKKSLLLKKDYKIIYTRFLNYSQDLERLINSYLWLSFKEPNLILEKHKTLLDYNKFLNERKDDLIKFIESNSLDPTFNLDNIYNFINLKNDEISSKLLDKDVKNKKELLKEQDYLLEIKRILKLDFFLKKRIINDDILLKSSFNNKENNINCYEYKPVNEYIFFKKLLKNEFSIKLYSISNHFNTLNLTNYKNHIFLGMYYDYIINNQDFFIIKDNFDFLLPFNSINKNLYMSEAELIKELFVINLQFYFDYMNSLELLYNDIFQSLNSFFVHLNTESDNIEDQMDNILKMALEITDNQLYNHNKILSKKLDKIELEWEKLNPSLKKINGLIEELNLFLMHFDNSIESFDNKIEDISKIVLLLNNDVFINFINDIDEVEIFDDLLLKGIPELFKKSDELLDLLHKIDDLIDDKYYFISTNSGTYYDLRECEREMSAFAQYNKEKRKIRLETLEQVHVFRMLLDKLKLILESKSNSLLEGKNAVLLCFDKLYEPFDELHMKYLNSLNSLKAWDKKNKK